VELSRARSPRRRARLPRTRRVERRAARRLRRVLPRDGRRHDAARRVSAQLEGRELLHRHNVAIFVASGSPLRTYLDARKRDGEGTVYFVTERKRVSGLRSELGAVRSFAELTDAATSYEFSLVRAEL
jgi:hypothetical protein